jgi:hypothetical protein
MTLTVDKDQQSNQFLSPNLQPRGHRESHLPRHIEEMNPYAHPNPGRASKHLSSRHNPKRAYVELDNSDDDDVDIDPFYQLPGLPNYATRSQEMLRRSHDNYNQQWQQPIPHTHNYSLPYHARQSSPQTYHSEPVATSSPGHLNHTAVNVNTNENKVQMSSRLSRIVGEPGPDFYSGPDAYTSSTPTTASSDQTLMQNNHDFEDVNLKATGESPQKKQDVKRVSYQEDYGTVFSPTSTIASPQAVFSPVSPVDASRPEAMGGPERDGTVVRRPLITINDSAVHEDQQDGDYQYLGPLVNIGREGDGGFDVPVFDQREARDVGGRYFAPGTAR